VRRDGVGSHAMYTAPTTWSAQDNLKDKENVENLKDTENA